MTVTLKNDRLIVYLVGAGPGDPGLITRRGLELLRAADVVVYDALVNRLLLSEAADDAELIDVGKRADEHKMAQDDINALLVDKARGGRLVVRLKGGDPYLFGRGVEEAGYLAGHGIDVEVVHGVTAGVSVAGCAGVPVTYRGVARTVTYVAGYEDPDGEKVSVNYRSLSELVIEGGTICFFMAVARLKKIAAKLVSCGCGVDTPAMVVQWGTMPTQRCVKGVLGDIGGCVEAAGLGSPSVVVVGQVVGLDLPGLDCFVKRRMFGKRVIVTRTRQQSSHLSSLLVEQGAEVLEAPTIQLVGPRDWQPLDEAIGQLDRADWLVLTSVNAVSALADRIEHLKLDARLLANTKVAAIGDATAGALWDRLRLRADLVPLTFVAESLAEVMIESHGVKGKRCVMFRADLARPDLPNLLTEAGGEVLDLVIYQTRVADALPQHVVEQLEQGAVDWITFTSSSTVRNMIEMLGRPRLAGKHLLDDVKTASIGPITSRTMRELGLKVDVETTVPTMAGLVDAISGYVAIES